MKLLLLGVLIGIVITIIFYEIYLKIVTYAVMHIDTEARDKDIYRFEFVKDPYYIRKHKRVIYKIHTGVDLHSKSQK